ncbi:hypothetical protein SDC9_92440 [bioreactor metagenome]|uniref:Uncharacterized protein n=1 Tax=bioreactor metagenome TaxID=1076179 RepID=A0A644ZZ84_9ZZZZ
MHIRDAVLLHKACTFGVRKFWQSLFNCRNPACNTHRHEVRLTEIAVVFCFFFRPHGNGYAPSFIEVAGFLHDLSSAADHVLLAHYLIEESPFNSFVGGYVFNLDTCSPVNRYVCIDTHSPFKVSIKNIQVFEDIPELVKESPGFFGAPHIRLGNGLDQGHA